MIPFPDQTYDVILADPPWSYADKTGRNMMSGSARKYPTMPLKDICDMDIQSISKKDSVLFLWATTPLLPEAFQVLSAWEFKYKTAIYWRKIMSLGLGYWFRGQVEVCLVGVRGNMKAFRSQQINFIQSKVRKHSQKPDELYGIIESLDLRSKIELFCRNRRQGWDAWGDQVSGSIQMILEVNK